jgi:Ankyrin repeats (3 copies)
MHLPITISTMTTAMKRPARVLGSSDDEKEEAEVDIMTRPAKAARIGAAATPLDVLMEAISRRDNRQNIPMALHPHNVLIKMLEKKGVKTSSHNFQDVENFFCKPSKQDIEAYDVNLLNFVRAGDVQQLRCRLAQGNSLHCSNKWGERLLHLACRKKQTAVVKFLIFEANVPVRVVDDMGRTVLHDACWTTEPCFELVDILLNQCPDLLYIKDIRGHSPLFYARREHWCQWMRHLAAKADSLIPTILPMERIPIPPRRTSVATPGA